jgi:GNAT superfamily N-acetyltransferase
MTMPPDPEVLYWSEMGEALAFRDTYQAAAQLPDDAVGAITSRPGGGVAFAFTKLDIPFFNRAIGIGVARPAVETDVDEVVAFYDAAGRGMSVAQIAPHATPPEVVGWFEARGYARGRKWVKMWHSLAEIPEARTDLRIERIGPEWADEFGRLSVVEAYDFPESIGPAAGAAVGSPGWAQYIGFDGDTPVSTAAMRIEDGVAWFGFGATSESHRGRGGQSAMFARRLHDAREAGCRFAVVETGEDTPEDPNPSYRNMVRAGFELAYFRHNWVRQAPSAG